MGQADGRRTMRGARRGLGVLAAGLLGLGAPASGAEGYRLYISVDMEGIAGAVSANQISPTGGDYQRFRKVMTDEVMAAMAGAREAGATQFVIADGHGDLQNLLIDDLPAAVRVIRGGPRPLGMMEGIQTGRFDGAMLIGYHASASSLSGVRAHTFSSSRLSEVRLNGAPASEGSINAAIAAQFGVPIILATGDDAAMEELRPAIGDAETVAVKRALGFQAADTLTPARAQEAIRAAAKRAVMALPARPSAKASAPVTIDLTFHYYRPAELLSWLPMVERTGARSVRFKAPDAAAAMTFVGFVLAYSPDLEP